MNIIVFGAGAIGSLYAAKLSAHHAVTVIGRPDHVMAIARDGLRVVGLESLACRVHAATAVSVMLPDTLVLLTTKVNDNQQAAAALAGVVRDDTIVLCVQNGLGSEAVVKDAIAERCLVLRAITQFGAIFRGPGVVPNGMWRGCHITCATSHVTHCSCSTVHHDTAIQSSS